MNFDEISHFCMKHEKLLSYAQIFFFSHFQIELAYFTNYNKSLYIYMYAHHLSSFKWRWQSQNSLAKILQLAELCWMLFSGLEKWN